MGLTIVTAPTIEPVTVAETREHLRIDEDDEDALLTTFIEIARDYCEGYQNRAYITQTWDLWLDDFPDSPFKIPFPPLTGQAEITAITCEADVAGSLNSKYWLCSSINTDYYVWYDINGAGVDPAIAGRTGIQVSAATSAAAAIIAAATAAAITAVDDFGAVVASAVVTVTNTNNGIVTDATDGDTGWSVAPNVIIQGQPPIVHIKYYDTASVEYTFPATNYETDIAGYRGRVALGYGKSWPSMTLRTMNGVVIRFIAGYGNDPSDVPKRIRNAVKFLVGHMYENREVTDIKEHIEVPLTLHALLDLDRIMLT